MLLPPPPSLLLRLRVSLCFLPSVSLTFSYHRLCPTDPFPLPSFLSHSLFPSLSLSLSFFPPSFVANQSPRGEKRDRRNSSQVSSQSLILSSFGPALFRLLTTHPFPSLQPCAPPATLMDACLLTRDPPRRCPSIDFVHGVRIRATLIFFHWRYTRLAGAPLRCWSFDLGSTFFLLFLLTY